MTVVTWVNRKSRLSTMIDEPGGLSVGVALAQAQSRIEAMQDRSQMIVAERIAELAALKPPSAADPDTARILAHAYHLSSAVIDAAGPFELDDLCAAAAGLCDLIDAAPTDRPFDWRIVTVHAQALQLMLKLPPEAVEARTQVLDNLREILARKLPPSTED